MTNRRGRPIGNLLLIANLLVLFSCDRDSPKVDGDVLATFSGGELRVSDLDQFILSQPPERRVPPKEVDSIDWLERQTEKLFEQSVLPRVYDLDEVRQEPQYQKGWSRQRNQILSLAYFGKKIQAIDISPDEAELKKYFEQHKTEFGQPERRMVRNILLRWPPDAQEQDRQVVRARAADLRQQIVDGASFENIAGRYSESSSKSLDGLVGWVEQNNFRRDIGEFVFALERGVVSDVFENPAGCQLFLVESVVPEAAPDFESARGQLAKRRIAELGAAKKQQLVDALVEQFGVDLIAEWPDLGLPAGVDAEKPIFTYGNQSFSGLDVFMLAQSSQNSPQEIYRHMAGEILLSAAFEEEFSAQVEANLRPARERFLAQYLANKLYSETLQATPDERLREFYLAQQSRFQTDQQVQLDIYYFPIGKGDPLNNLKVPEKFANDIRDDLGKRNDMWSSFDTKPGHDFYELPATAIRQLIFQMPLIAPLIPEDVTPGMVIGPFHSGDRIAVVVVGDVLTGQPLSFEDARQHVLQLYSSTAANEISRQASLALRSKFDLTIYRQHLKNFGASFVNPSP